MVLIPDRAILAMMGGQTLIWAALFYSFVGLVPAWQANFAWPDTALMGGFSLAAVLWALATPFAGRAIDHGLGPWLMPGAALLGAGLLLALSWVETYRAFLVIWAGLGLCMAATLYEPAFAMVLRARAKTARAGITAIAIAAGFASTLAYPVVHWVTEAHGWRVAIQVMAIIAAVLAVPMLALGARWLEAEAPPAAKRTRSAGAWRRMMHLPNLALLALAFALVAFIPGSMIAHLFPLMADRGVPTGTAVLAASLIGPAQVAGRILVTWIAPQAQAARITLAAMLALVVSTGLMAIAGWGSGVIFAAVLIYGIGNGLVGIFRPVLARERYGSEDIGAVAGALAGPALFLAAFAPVIGAYLTAWGGYGLMLGVAAAAGLLAACLLRATEPRR